jgi:hypothetical protein
VFTQRPVLRLLLWATQLAKQKPTASGW